MTAADWDQQITAPHPNAEAAALVAAIDAEKRDVPDLAQLLLDSLRERRAS